MRDKLLDLMDRIPRWGELDSRGRGIAVGSTALVVVVLLVLALWGTGVIGGGDGDGNSNPTAADLPYEGGVVDCERWPTPRGVEGGEQLGVAGSGNGLPYRANLADSSMQGSPGELIAIIAICMEPDATREEITDTATVIAQNVKAGFPKQAELAGMVVDYLGTGDTAKAQLTTQWANNAFNKDAPVADQRAAWEWDPNPIN